MGIYANTVNAYAQDYANAHVNKRKVRLIDYGQRSYMLNVSVNKFRTDVYNKAQKLIPALQQQRIVNLQAEIVRLQTTQITLQR